MSQKDKKVTLHVPSDLRRCTMIIGDVALDSCPPKETLFIKLNCKYL